MGLFKKKKEIVITGTVCAACGMSFATTDRLMRHMFKAHGKQKKVLLVMDAQTVDRTISKAYFIRSKIPIYAYQNTQT